MKTIEKTRTEGNKQTAHLR